jgi:hypothetical protein
MLSEMEWSWWRREEIWASRSWSMEWRVDCSRDWGGAVLGMVNI